MDPLREFRTSAIYLAFGAVVVSLYFVLPAGNAMESLYYVVGWSTVAAILLGIRMHRPSSVAPWLCFAVGTASFAVGDILSDRAPNPLLLSEGFYLAGYPLIAAGLVILIYRAGGHHRLAAIDEAGIATFAFAIFQWVFLTRPAMNAVGVDFTTRAVNAAYSGADVILLAGFAGFFVSAAWKKPSFLLLVGGVAALLFGDEIYALTASSYYSGAPNDAAWLASYLLVGAAALHPSMRELAEPRRGSALRVSNARIALLAGALLAPAAILALQYAREKPLEVPAIVAATAAISLLVLWRLIGILRALEGLRLRERTVRGEAEAAQMLLAEQNARLQEADQLKDEFVSLVSHDLRTPLTSVIGYTELALEEAGEDANGRRYLEIVARNAQRLLRLVDDLLFIARLQAGRGLELAPTPLDLALVAQQAVLEAQPRARDKGLHLRYTGEETVALIADRGRIFQLLDNLVGNAIKFTPAGGLVEVTAAGDGETVTLEVQDTGIGLDPADAGRLFERFYRTERATSAQIPGTGLGLYIAEAIAVAHGGRITARPRDGGGTIFHVELPAAPPPEDARATGVEMVA